MKECIQYKDATLFFRATRERLRLEIGTFYKHANPSSLSSHELNSLLQQGSNDEGVISGIQKILLASDNQEFAETEKDTQSLETLYREMNDLLKKIK